MFACPSSSYLQGHKEYVLFILDEELFPNDLILLKEIKMGQWEDISSVSQEGNVRKSASLKTHSLFDELRTEELACAKKASQISNNPLFLMSLPIFHTVVRNQFCYISREP